jgi:hypothetical protein
MNGKSNPNASYSYRLRNLVSEVLTIRETLRRALEPIADDVQDDGGAALYVIWDEVPLELRATPEDDEVFIYIEGRDLLIRDWSKSFPRVEWASVTKDGLLNDSLVVHLKPKLDAVAESVRGQQPNRTHM